MFCIFFLPFFKRSAVRLPSCCGQERNLDGGVTVPLQLLFWRLPMCLLSLSLLFETSLDSLVSIITPVQGVTQISENLIKLCISGLWTFNYVLFFNTGASAAAMLIFILPSAFYIKLVKKEPMKSVQKIGVCIGRYVILTLAS